MKFTEVTMKSSLVRDQPPKGQRVGTVDDLDPFDIQEKAEPQEINGGLMLTLMKLKSKIKKKREKKAADVKNGTSFRAGKQFSRLAQQAKGMIQRKMLKQRKENLKLGQPIFDAVTKLTAPEKRAKTTDPAKMKRGSGKASPDKLRTPHRPSQKSTKHLSPKPADSSQSKLQSKLERFDKQTPLQQNTSAEREKKQSILSVFQKPKNDARTMESAMGPILPPVLRQKPQTTKYGKRRKINYIGQNKRLATTIGRKRRAQTRHAHKRKRAVTTRQSKRVGKFQYALYDLMRACSPKNRFYPAVNRDKNARTP
jgi:hypothetical protein